MAKATKKSKKTKDVEEDVKETKKSKKKAKAEAIEGFDPYAMFQTTMDDIANKHGVSSDLMEDLPPLSTGNLAMDLVYGGGLRPAMLVHSGYEQSAKTTGALVAMAAAVKQRVPIIALWDYEGSSRSAKRYIGNIIRTVSGMKKKHVFGKKDEDGRWEVRPTVQFFSETRGEKFFDWMANLLRNLPDKRLIKDKWWLVYDDNKENKAKYGQYSEPSMAKKYGKGVWVPAPDDGLQALVLLDSLPAMNPPSNDDDNADNSLGVHARFFAKHLPRIKGRLASKMVCLLSINQLRAIPMAMYGPKEKEACGNAVAYNSDARVWWTSRSSGMPFNPVFDKDESLELENSVEYEGMHDRYRYVQLKAKKNKLALPGRKVWIRIWVEDGGSDARGFDPVFDVAQYLKLTGQLSGKRKKLALDLHKFGQSKPFDWDTLKRWILGEKDEKIKICKKLGYSKPFDLKALCFDQLKSGIGEQMFSEARKAKAGSEDDE